MGLASALAFVREGARVVAVGRDQESVAEAGAALGGCGVAFQAEATDPETAPGPFNSAWRSSPASTASFT